MQARHWSISQACGERFLRDRNGILQPILLDLAGALLLGEWMEKPFVVTWKAFGFGHQSHAWLLTR